MLKSLDASYTRKKMLIKPTDVTVTMKITKSSTGTGTGQASGV